MRFREGIRNLACVAAGPAQDINTRPNKYLYIAQKKQTFRFIESFAEN